jgi:Fe-Mn family superoxide dismutase
MEGFSDALLKLHFSLYEGYVKNVNELLATIRALIDQGKGGTAAFMALKRRLGWEFDGMVLHELYFENLGGTQSLAVTSPLYQKIVQDFGSFQRWKADFLATGLIRGIGWAILYQDPKDGRLINAWINEHDVGHLAGGRPILVMDVWEHAYITEYELDRAGYADAFFKNIHWNIVEGRLNAKK